jgi:D-alanyl-D-alanine carboxypeptidase
MPRAGRRRPTNALVAAVALATALTACSSTGGLEAASGGSLPARGTVAGSTLVEGTEPADPSSTEGTAVPASEPCPPGEPVTADQVLDPSPASLDDVPAPTSGPYPVPSPLDDGELTDGPELQAVLDDAFGDLTNSPGAMALVWVPGVGSWRGGVGRADVVADAPMDTERYFHIGSATKPFTVMTVLKLVEQGELSLDDTVGQWFPDMPDGDTITVRQLTNMTSGLGTFNESSQPFFERMEEGKTATFEPMELVEFGLELPRKHAPGAEFFYTNTGTVMLLLIVEQVTGRPFADVLDEEVLAPLGLTNTAFPPVEGEVMPRPAIHGYFCNDAVIDVTDWNTSWGSSAGAMTSTLDDLAVWSHQLGSGGFVDPELYAEQTDFRTIGDLGYGVGMANFGGWYGHNGGMPGYTTFGVYNPELNVVLALNVNSDFATTVVDSKGEERKDTPAVALFHAFQQAITETPS